MRRIFIQLAAVLSLFFSMSCYGVENNSDIRTKELFVRVYNYSLIPQEKQKKFLPEIYKDIVPFTFEPVSAASFAVYVFPPDNLTSEEKKDWMLKNYSIGQLRHLIEDLGLGILKGNLAETSGLVTRDIDSKNNTKIKRALEYIRRLQLKEFKEKVISIFKGSKDLELNAAYALKDLRAYNAIDILIKKPVSPVEYFEILRYIQTKQKAHPAVLALLDSRDPEIRWKAVYILSESGDPVLVDWVKKLSKDSSPQVRENVVHMGFNLDDNAYKEVYDSLTALLKDKDISVRVAAACAFPWKHDEICAKTLLELLKDETLIETTHSNIVSAIQTLTGSDFGYYSGSDAWKPTTQNNIKAIKAFEEWITNNVK